MTGENPPGADRYVKSLPGEVTVEGDEYEFVEGELMPRAPHERPWDPMLDLR